MDAEELERLSKGIMDENPAAQLAVEMNKWQDYPKKSARKIYTFRRGLRRTLFTIRIHVVQDTLDELTLSEKALWKIFDSQLDSNYALTWEQFTFKWDVHPVHLLTIINEEQWFNEGGSVDEIGRKAPTAFTQQEV